MHLEVLTPKQIKLLPFLKIFGKDFGLVGGTAIALHLGHRRSIDFDLFTNQPFDNLKIQKKILKSKKITRVLIDQKDEYTVVVSGVKITFLYYPFKIEFKNKLDNSIRTADLLTLAALKAYALGRRSKWKDYVDLYLIVKNKYSLGQIIKKAEHIFGKNFNEKIFRVQLAYFKDIDDSEELIFLKGHRVSKQKIKNRLIEFSLK